MKRVAVALLALMGLLLPALFGRADEAGAQAVRGPSFIAAAATWTLDDRADGSTTAIAIGTPPIRAGTISGGTDACALSATNGQYANPSDDPADFIEPDTAGATAVNVFAVAPATCAITYTGSGATRMEGTLEAYSLTVTISDGVDAAGATDARVDDTIRVTVRILSAATDREALDKFYTATGGDGWTNGANWNEGPVTETATLHTFELTAGTGSGFVGYNSSVGSVRNDSGIVPLSPLSLRSRPATRPQPGALTPAQPGNQSRALSVASKSPVVVVSRFAGAVHCQW